MNPRPDNDTAHQANRIATPEKLENLEALANFVEDLNSHLIADTERNFEELVRQRFGAGTSPETVRRTMQALIDIPLPEPRTQIRS